MNVIRINNRCVLVIDRSRSMQLWQESIQELQAALAQQHGLQAVQIWSMICDKENIQLEPLRTDPPASPVAPGEQRLILVLTDCVSPAWHSGDAPQQLAAWGQHHPLAILQMLPQRLWRGTALGKTVTVPLQRAEASSPNSRLRVDADRLCLHQPALTDIKIPVLEAASLADWLQARKISGAVFPAERDKAESGAVKEQNASWHVQHFYATASPAAQALARYFACAPLTLPVMRLVQRLMLPESQTAELAEVFLSGLLRETTAQTEDAGELHYDFHPDVREILLDAVLTSEALYVFTQVARQAERKPPAFDFQALLENPAAFLLLARDRAFAAIGAKVLRRLGGDYRRLAMRVEKTIALQVDDTSLPILDAEMANTWERLNRDQHRNIRNSLRTGDREIWLHYWNQLYFEKAPKEVNRPDWWNRLKHLQTWLESYYSLRLQAREDQEPIPHEQEFPESLAPARKPPVNALEALQKVTREVENILLLLKTNDPHKIYLAKRYTEELLDEEQQAGTAGKHIAKTLSNIAAAATKTGLFEWAAGLYEQARQHNSVDPVIYAGLAEVLKAQSQYPQAEALYRETMDKWPLDVVARTGLAEVLKAQSQYPQAEALYRETMDKWPDDVMVRTGLAEVLKAQSQYPQAEALYRETMDKWPDNVV
ncbi:MAG: tetratricopeptide repeat protein, partial [Gammaproteobacteria bacterium]|nr:tetratricopeptide repeat protein [Gammaproteobacteria bacterium]